MTTQLLRRIDRIVIGYRYQVHAAPLQKLVELRRLVVGLSANSREHRHCTHARMHRVNVKVALHDSVVTVGPLQIGDYRRNIREGVWN